MKIYAIRHGATKLNKEKKVNGQIDEPLSFEGLEETKSFLSHLPESVIQINSSSMLRAKQTTEIIQTKQNFPFSLHDELREIHMGSLAGKSWEEMDRGLELKDKHRTVQFDYRPYGGESVEDVKKRLLIFFKKINNTLDDCQVLVITHGGIIRILRFLETGKAIYETEKHMSLLTFDLDKILSKI